MRRTLTEDEEEEKRRQYWVEEWKGSYRKKTVGASHERLSRFVGGRMDGSLVEWGENAILMVVGESEWLSFD